LGLRKLSVLKFYCYIRLYFYEIVEQILYKYLDLFYVDFQ